MDGFLASVVGVHRRCANNPNFPACRLGNRIDVMGFHGARQIPNYCAYADGVVLQDHMFESTRTWRLTSHLSMVSGWAGLCSNPDVPMSWRAWRGPPARIV